MFCSERLEIVLHRLVRSNDALSPPFMLPNIKVELWRPDPGLSQTMAAENAIPWT